MKNTYFFLLICFFPFVLNAQEYSNTGVGYYIQRIEKQVSDTIYDVEGKVTAVHYMVFDNNTSPGINTDPNHSDNKVFDTFLKLYATSKVSDFMMMAEHPNPSIRVYALWAVLRKGRYRKARMILEQEKAYHEEVYWLSIGCDILPESTVGLMRHLYTRIKKYGY